MRPQELQGKVAAQSTPVEEPTAESKCEGQSSMHRCPDARLRHKDRFGVKQKPEPRLLGTAQIGNLVERETRVSTHITQMRAIRLGCA